MIMRAKIEYFDIILAVINLIVLSIAAILIHTNLILIIICLLSLGFLGGLSIFTFMQKNPYYISTCYGLAVLGLIFNIGLVFIPFLFNYTFLFVVFILLNVFYLGSSVKGSASSSSKFATIAGVKTIIETGKNRPTYLKDKHGALESDKVDENSLKDKRGSIQTEYKARLIIRITMISVFIYVLTFMFFQI